MKTMVRRRRIGLINLSAEDFSESCLPYPSKVIKAINERLPVVASKKNDELLTIIKAGTLCF